MFQLLLVALIWDEFILKCLGFTEKGFNIRLKPNAFCKFVVVVSFNRIKKLNMNRLLTLSFFVFCAFSLRAQDVSKFVPNDALVVMSINSESYSKKVDMDKVWDLDLFKMMDETVQKQAKDN